MPTNIYSPVADVIRFSTGGVDRVTVANQGLLFATDNTIDVGAAGATRPRDLFLARNAVIGGTLGVSGVTTLATLDAPLLTPTGNIIEQRNGTSAQTTYLFNTYTDAGNYERLTTYWSGNVAFIQIEQAGTGGNRQLKVGTVGTGTLFFKTWGADRWQIPAAGHLLAVADNTYDIGAAGATRPRNLFVGGAVATGVKAGAPVDADVNTPTDGMLRVDTTNHRLYVRDGGTWRYATLT